jgi:hypothetical protein
MMSLYSRRVGLKLCLELPVIVVSFVYHHRRRRRHGQNDHFRAIAFVTRFCQFYPVFICLDFAAVIFYRVRSSALRPTPNLEDQVPVFMSLSDRVGQLYPQPPGSLFVAFSYWQVYGGGILTRLYTGFLCVLFVIY